MLRSIARSIRYAPDRLLHRRRESQAHEVLAGRTGGRVLFVCHGNICRSPYAEHALRRELDAEGEQRWSVESAGFIKPDRPSPVEARAVAACRDVDLETHRSRTMTTELVSGFDLIYVMSASQARSIRELFGARPESVWILGDLDPAAVIKRTIRDPVEQPEEVFEEVYDQIDRCVRVIAKRLSAPATAPR
jgi:protein-tyrosine phosphatase